MFRIWPLTKQLPPTVAPVPRPTPTSVPETIKVTNYCPHCGSKLDEGGSYCGICGSPLYEN